MREKCGSRVPPANCGHACSSRPGPRGTVRLLARALANLRRRMRRPAADRERIAGGARGRRRWRPRPGWRIRWGKADRGIGSSRGSRYLPAADRRRRRGQLDPQYRRGPHHGARDRAGWRNAVGRTSAEAVRRGEIRFERPGAVDLAVVGGTFGAYVDASVSEVSFGRGALRASDGADGFLVAISAEGATRWTSVVGEQGDDEVVALATHDGAVHAAANVHRERIGARCGGHVVVLRNREWARVEEDECLSARAAAFD